MRMLLTSNGISTEAIRQELEHQLGASTAQARIVVVLDAILGFPGDNSTLLEHLRELRALGWAEFDVASLFAGPASLVESRLRSADVILGYGGSNLWLAHAWHATGLAPVLAELLDEKIYVGWSAGSMIFARRLDRWAPDFDDEEELELFGLDGVDAAVPLFDWFFMGHRGAEWMPDTSDERASRGAARTGQRVWFVDDATALLVTDRATDPVVVGGGHWLRFAPDGTLEAEA